MPFEYKTQMQRIGNADAADLRGYTDFKNVGGCFCVQDLVNLFLIYQVYSGERAYFIFVKKKKSVSF
jgi:hypothetical protein